MTYAQLTHFPTRGRPRDTSRAHGFHFDRPGSHAGQLMQSMHPPIACLGRNDAQTTEGW